MFSPYVEYKIKKLDAPKVVKGLLQKYKGIGRGREKRNRRREAGMESGFSYSMICA
jgi:hypothetical protein